MNNLNKLFNSLNLRKNTLNIDDERLNRIVDGYETDIEYENEVFKDEEDSILDSIHYYLKNKKKKLLEILNYKEQDELSNKFNKMSI